MPSIAANDAGSVVLGFTRTGGGLNEFPSAYAAVGHTAQGKTTFGSPILLKAGADVYHFIPGQPQNDRWGDYSATLVDPNNPQTFWTFQEWAAPSFTPPLFGAALGRWATQVTQITVPTGGGHAAAPAGGPRVTLVDLPGDDATGATLSAADAARGQVLQPRPKVKSRLY
jgi:hypothetical protein